MKMAKKVYRHNRLWERRKRKRRRRSLLNKKVRSLFKHLRRVLCGNKRK